MFNMKRGLAIALCACLSFTALTGCSKSGSDALDTSKAMFSIDDDHQITAGEANFYFRYEQAEFENGIGSFIKSYYGDIWNSDLTGSGESYGSVYKEQVEEALEKMLLASAAAESYGVSLTDEEKQAITDAAASFISSNAEDVLTAMSATQETVEGVLTLYTIQQKVEDAMSADVDTNVSDEEAAQRTVSYVEFEATTEEETEAVSEAESEGTSEAGEGVGEVVSAGDEQTEETTEATTAAVEDETDVKTGTAAASETETEAVEAATEAATESVLEGAQEAATEVTTEAETETETDSPQMAAAKARALAAAEAFLASAGDNISTDDFNALAEAAQENDSSVYSSSYTFGDSDSYPDSAIIEATKDLSDGTVVDHVVNVGDNYYVLHIDDAFDEEATAEEKESIIQNRRDDMIDAAYETLQGEYTITVDTETWQSLVYDVSFTEIAEEETDSVSEEAATEASTAQAAQEEAGEGVGEVTQVTQAAAEEAQTEAVTEAATELATAAEASAN